MKVVILAGGYGTRITEESHLRPKPMIEIGEKPILWHIMKEYAFYGFNDFVICAGYKQHIIKEWFANYFLHNSDVTFDFTNGINDMTVHNQYCEQWRISIIDTGLETMTGGRIKRVEKYLNNETFMMTYGDAVSDVNLSELLEFHRAQGRIATITSVKYEQLKGVLDITNELVQSFREKSDIDTIRINGGYMVLEPKIFDYLQDDKTIFEKDPMERLANEKQLAAYRHNGFWQCMDTKREMEKLEEMFQHRTAPWVKWKY